MSKLTIGVLALQGAFAKHQQMLSSLNVNSCIVKTASDLDGCHGLILPGGESTTMRYILQETNLLPALSNFALSHPLLGTCAGMILMTTTLKLLDIQIARNAYGSQRHSFSIPLPFQNTPFPCLFIRAPQIEKILSPQIKTLMHWNHTPIFIQQANHLGCSFHPELTKDPRIHQYFVELCNQKQSPPQQ